MPREVAHDYLVAAAEAWPFASEAAFRISLLHLHREGPGIFDPPTEQLAKDLQDWLRPRAGGTSLETLRRICESTWFPEQYDKRSLADVLADIAADTIQFDGSCVVLKRDHNYAERLAHARWLSLLLPQDLLIAAGAASARLAPPGDTIHLSSFHLDQLLREKPVAETHLHLGAAVSFPVLWNTLLPALGRDAPVPSAFQDAPLGGSESFLYLLTAAAICRLVLAAYLRRCARNENVGTFAEDFDKYTANLKKNLVWAWGPENAIGALRLTMRAVATGDPHSAMPLPRLAALHRALHGFSTTTPAESLAEILERDPMASWLAPGPGRALSETQFATRALSYLLDEGHDDTSFATLFWQYQRIRCATYRYLVQEPGTPGLDWFMKHYNRVKPLRRGHGKAKIDMALHLQSSGLRLGALEARIGPDHSWANLREEIRTTAKQAARFVPALRDDPPEIALILHFLKERERRQGRRRALHADPRQYAHGVRFGVWGYSTLRTVMAIETTLTRCPELLTLFRGIDIAAAELAVPTWPLVPMFTRLREASKRAAAVMHRRHPAWEVKPFRMTCHAGEDYGRLVEGLRHVHELIEFGILGPSDRIGHGVCLGDNVERCFQNTRRSPQPAEERLDDLLWELDRYAYGELRVDSGRLAYATDEASRLARRIYGNRIQLDELREARRMRHVPQWLARFGFPFRRDIQPTNDVEKLLLAYLRDEYVFRRGQELVDVVATEAEVTFLGAAQSWLRGEVARLEITVESNPSSNWLIGDFVKYEEHPSFRMTTLPGREATPEHRSLLLSINTDDPITFAACLADEYTHLYGALVRSGVSSAHALEWLTARRDQGYRSRFSLAASANGEILQRIAERRNT